MPGLNINPEYMGEERRELSLLELNNLVRGVVSEAFLALAGFVRR